MNRNNILARFATTASAIALLALSTPSSALIISTLQLDKPVGNPAIYTEVSVVNATRDDVGSQFQSNWFLDADTFGGTVDLSASAQWTISEFSDDSFGLTIDISNDTRAPLNADFNAAILSFGFATNPDTDARIVDAGNANDIFTGIGEGSGKKQNFPGGFKGIDVCIHSQGCSGGAIKKGLNVGQSDYLEIMLSPDSGLFGDSLEMSIFAIKFQGTEGSYEFLSAPNSTTPVPVPGAFVLFGTGALILGTLRRRVLS